MCINFVSVFSNTNTFLPFNITHYNVLWRKIKNLISADGNMAFSINYDILGKHTTVRKKKNTYDIIFVYK